MASVSAYPLRLFPALLAAALPAAAVTTILNPPPSEVRLRVGAAGGVTLVQFNITAANAGNGNPINQAGGAILVRAEAREAGCAAKNATLTVTTPANLTSGGNTIPFSTISWTTSDADISPGTYLAPGTQTIATFQNCRRVQNNHTFRFSNATVYPSGTYNGTATYTLSMP